VGGRRVGGGVGWVVGWGGRGGRRMKHTP